MTVIDRSVLPAIGLSKEEMSDPAHFALELATFFRRGWLYVGQESELSKPGDYMTFDLGNDSVIVVRDEHGTIHAHHNTCRHRGAQLVDPGQGNCRRALVCSYHGWTYAHDGSLRGAPQMGDDFAKDDWPLRPAHAEVWEGFVFVSLAESRPRSVADQLDGADFSPYRLSHTRLLARRTQVVQANWKVLWENGLECYHCAINHPEAAKIVEVRRRGPQSSHVEAGEFDFRPEYPLLDGVKSLTMDGEFGAPLFLGEEGKPPRNVSFLSWHTSLFEVIAAPEHVHVMWYTPLSSNTTMVSTAILVNRDLDDSEVDAEHLFALQGITRLQDNGLCEKVQRGIESGAFQPGPYNYDYEFGNQNFVRLYRDVMSEMRA